MRWPVCQDRELISILTTRRVLVDFCPQCQSIWLDKEELEKIPAAREVKLKINIDRGTSSLKSTPEEPVPISLPDLGLASGTTLFLLYGIPGLVLITLVNFNIVSSFRALVIGVVSAIFQFLLSPFIMDISLRWFYRVSWASYENLPLHLKNFFRNICEKCKIKTLRIGIIPDSSSNAFTYGYIPDNTRIVITSGIMNLLEPQELEPIVVHKISHVLH